MKFYNRQTIGNEDPRDPETHSASEEGSGWALAADLELGGLRRMSELMVSDSV